jgi:type II secretory pathway component PulF
VRDRDWNRGWTQRGDGLPTFTYKALGHEGTASEGTIVATTRREALQRLIDSGQNPLDLKEHGARASSGTIGIRLRRRIIRLATFTGQLATLSQSGVPIVRSLNVLIEQQKDARVANLITEVRESIQGGSTFAEALGKHPQHFPKLMTSMVAVGEQGGTLDEQLLELSGLYEREEALRGEVVAAIAYPILVLVTGLISTVILVAFFIPKLEALFEGVGQALPAPTRILLGISHFVQDYRWHLLVGAVACALVWQVAARSKEVSMRYDRWKLHVPWLGNVLRNLAIARLTRVLGTLTHGGISIVEALGIAEPVMGNRAIAAAVHEITARVRTGESLAALMHESDIFPPLSVQMAAVGEETGLLDQMLLRVADAYDRETLAATKLMTSMLAPALILLVAGIIGFILIAMMLPIFQLSTVMR